MDITPDEIAALLPGSRVIEIPTAWFNNLQDNCNAFEQFYAYLRSLGCEDNRDLHNRARVGHRLQKKLIQAEKQRLKKVHGLSGDNLKRALSWNDVGSGPQETFAGRRVTGNAVCVLPRSSAKENEVQSRLIREQCEIHQQQLKKSRTKLSGSSFYYWLIAAKEHNDRIGDIARDVADDVRFPREATTYREVAKYLDCIAASSAAIECAEDAWLEYIDRYPERIEASAWCDLCDTKIEPNEGAVVFRSGYEVLHDLCNSDRLDEEEKLLIGDLHRDGLRAFLLFAEPHDGFWSADVEKRLRLWGFRDHNPRKEQVYFVQVGFSGPIKIGYTATSVIQRVASLQTSCPEKLRLLASIDGGRAIEAELHVRFAKYRKTGEWFEPHPDLIAFLAPIVKPNV